MTGSQLESGTPLTVDVPDRGTADVCRAYSPTGAFWSRFIRDHWEKQPVRFPGFFRPGIADDGDLLAAVVEMPDGFKADRCWLAQRTPVRSREDFKFVPLTGFGPRASDRSLGEFFARANKEFLGRPFGINRHRLQLTHPSMWFRFREFIRGLTQRLGGLPTHKWELDTFFGTYEATPFGIHQDNASVFSFGVWGRRRFCFWPHEYFAPDDPVLRTPDREKIEPHLNNATIVDMEPGDLVYWPSSHWHIVLSDGEPSATVQASAYFGTKLSDLIGQSVERLLRTRVAQNEPSMFPFSNGNLPLNIAAARTALDELMSDGTLDHQLQKSWLKRCTADGFVEVPTMKTESQLSEDHFLELVAPGCLAWMPAPEGSLDVFANGLRFEQPNQPEIHRVLESLSNGERLSFNECGAANSQTIRELVGSLDRCRVFRPCERLHR